MRYRQSSARTVLRQHNHRYILDISQTKILVNQFVKFYKKNLSFNFIWSPPVQSMRCRLQSWTPTLITKESIQICFLIIKHFWNPFSVCVSFLLPPPLFLSLLCGAPTLWVTFNNIWNMFRFILWQYVSQFTNSKCINLRLFLKADGFTRKKSLTFSCDSHFAVLVKILWNLLVCSGEEGAEGEWANWGVTD